MISIITSAHNAAEFIDDYMNSVLGQTLFNPVNLGFIDHNYSAYRKKAIYDFEILVGIDACHKTFEKLLDYKPRPPQLQILLFDKKVGTYRIRNTLATKAKGDYLLFFDIDDIMYPDMVWQSVVHRKKADFIRYTFDELWEIPLEQYPLWRAEVSHGQLFIKKKLFDEFGGFMPWENSADSEFIQRMKKHGNKQFVIGPAFQRRRHNKSLVYRYPDLAERNKRINDAFRSDVKRIARIGGECDWY